MSEKTVPRATRSSSIRRPASPSFASIVVVSALAELIGASFFVYVIARALAANPASADFSDKYVVASALWYFWYFLSR